MRHTKLTPLPLQTLAASCLRPVIFSPHPRLFHQTTARLRSPTVSETQSEHKPNPSEGKDEQQHSGAPKPKISNLSAPGVDTAKHLSEEQKEEVRKHNEDFEEKHERGGNAQDDKVDKSFWSGGGTRKGPGVTRHDRGGKTKD